MTSPLKLSDLLLLSAVTLALTTACEGPEGSAGTDGVDGIDGTDGDDGTDGTDGTDGEDLLNEAPEDTYFSFAVTNNSGGSHEGKGVLNLDFDGTTGSADTVAAPFLTSPPQINGKDGGVDDEWGGLESVVVFDEIAGSGNGTTSAILRAGYDSDFVYFFASWDEDTGHSGYGESYHRKMWTYSGGAWSQGGNEDRVFFMFPINDIADFATDGCAAACHGDAMYVGPGEFADVWHYKHARTGPTQTADDKWWDEDGRHSDQGLSAYVDNFDGDEHLSSDKVLYQYLADPGANMDYPVWVWEMIPFQADAAWTEGDTIPGVINRQPTGSRGDVTANCDYAEPTWTCEFKRLRQTGNGDDRQF